ncbi:S8 family serine peptidase [Desulfopila sp. IMCC35008]|uniref:S53 family peptidase n=1 Tax=Desulfopila sp. IMCC35008 TaxID=2653858 RepID=UPI0013D5E60E|nr:S53 family peptidase [Desulfopila sp. IMCC35008]
MKTYTCIRSCRGNRSTLWFFILFCWILLGTAGPVMVHAGELEQRTLLLRPPVSAPAIDDQTLVQMSVTSPQKRHYLSRKDFGRIYGIDAADLQLIKTFANDNQLTMQRVDLASRLITLSGTKESLDTLDSLPKEVAKRVAHIFSEEKEPTNHAQATPQPPQIPSFRVQSYTPPQLAQLYDFPEELDGKGQTIAIIAFDMGFQRNVLKAYFSALGKPLPEIVTVPVGGFTPPQRSDFEVTMDIEVAGSMAPGAKIVVYLADNSPRGWYEAMATAIHDPIHRPDILSVSFAFYEDEERKEVMHLHNRLFSEAALLGVTVTAAAGDLGSGAGAPDCLAHAYFPASSPYVLAVGGTTLISTTKPLGRYAEVAWDARAFGGLVTGGGVSQYFQLPQWQQVAHVPYSANPAWPGSVYVKKDATWTRAGRGFPDVAAHADNFFSGILIAVEEKKGKALMVEEGGGTSAAAPLWAALIARLNQGVGNRLGYLNPLLYRLQLIERQDLFNDITIGNNGAYNAGPGWDPLSGLGTPKGKALLKALRKLQ